MMFVRSGPGAEVWRCLGCKRTFLVMPTQRDNQLAAHECGVFEALGPSIPSSLVRPPEGQCGYRKMPCPTLDQLDQRQR